MTTKNTVWVLAPNEDWICDRLVKEWNTDNFDITVADPNAADVIWLYSDWCWNQVSRQVLFQKKVIVTVHHVVPEKFGPRERIEFEFRDRFVTAYHVPNIHTLSFVESLTKKPVHLIPYWANQRIWFSTESKNSLRDKHKLPHGFLVGSFQRDTEGHDLISPKLEKGPDIFADALIEFHKQSPNLHVVLAGWRRQYLIKRLTDAGISYSFFERPVQSVINELYQTLDLYVVSSRYEGGPQSLIECGLLNIPVVSRDVGIASQVLPQNAVNNIITECQPAVPQIDDLKIPQGYTKYRHMIESL